MNARRPISAALCALAGVLALASVPALAGASKGVVGFFGGTGTAGGLFNTPGGVAVNDTTGNVYAVDINNNRVQEFSSGGAFIRAWGLGVVSAGQDSGGTSTVEKVTITGTSGMFTLSLSGQTTSAIAYDAPSSIVEAALDALPTIGSVAVVGEGTNINPYEVTFGGSRRGSEVAAMTVNTSGLGAPVGVSLSCVAGPASATTKTYQWLRNGVAIAGATSSTYMTTIEDEGDVVQCQVFAINANAGSTQVGATAVVSPEPAMALPAPPTSIERPTITTGQLTVGGPGGASLSCAAGSWTGAASFSYQWYRNGVALSGNGANTSTYTVQSADLAAPAVFQCAVTGTDEGGGVTRVSANLATEPKPTAPTAPAATATVTIPVLATVVRTAVGAPAFEVCNATSSPQDVCNAGVAGPAAGAMSAPQGVAVEQTSGDVYVTDQGNHRVDEFTAAGEFVRVFGWGVETGAAKLQVCTSMCMAGAVGAGAGEFGAIIGYPAVDPSTGDVYVADSANTRVQVFEGDGVFVHAFGWGVTNGTGEFQVCTSTCQAGVVSASEIDLGRFAAGSPTRVALDASGNAFAVDGGAPDYRVQKFAPVSKENTPLIEFFASGQLIGTSSATAPSDVAVEPALGNVLAAREPSSPEEHLVYELRSGGALLGTYGEGAALPAPMGLAVGSSGGSVYFSTASNNRVFVLGTTVAPTVTVEAATGPTASEAILHGTVDPNETQSNGIETTWQFEYSTNQTEWTPLTTGKLTASTSPVAVSQIVTGLEGGTVYYVRLHASKEFAAGSATSTTVQFRTGAAPPTVSDEAVSKVAATSAVFSARINPQHLDATYHFEYDTAPYTTSAAHGTNIPIPDAADIGEGVSNVSVSQEPQTLKPDTTYHYRVVATNSAEATYGPEHTFTTQTQGEGFALLDGRAWEMVSPPNKNGAVIGSLGGEFIGGVIQAAAGGGAFTWVASAAVGPEPAGNLSFAWSQIFSTRGAGGWSSKDISPPRDFPTGATVYTEYKFFSPDLSLGLIEPQGTEGVSPLSPGVTEKTLYLRDDAGDSYLPLVTPANTPPGTKIDRQTNTGIEGPTFDGATPDLSHVVFEGPAGLDPSYPAAEGPLGLYEWAGGQLQLVSVLPLPDGEPGGGVLGTFAEGKENARHAISNDGSHVFWTANNVLYMRDTRRGETLRLSPGAGVFQTASSDGSRVFFTEGGSLYECVILEAAAGDECRLSDLTPANGSENPDVQGLLPGASEDGSYVYLVAGGVLSEAENAEHEKAESDANNLYVLHGTDAGWATTFIAQLSGEDADDWAQGGGKAALERLTSRVSPDGRYFAFMSDRELTGYDNHDANSGAADEEVFLYDAGTERLVCASCDPTAARPVGVFDAGRVLETPMIVDDPEAWRGRWLAANIPGWTPATNYTAYYQSRYLSDNGRLFFNSSDALVPQDVNGTEDVYEFEPSGMGSCTNEGSTFDAMKGGCVSLISSGSSAEESAFLDASEGGGGVFFLTAAKLLPQDKDTSLDVYDAHECTTEVPCVSAPVSPPECTTADACREAPTPQPSIFGSPASATFSGAGNPVPAPTAAKVKAKAKPLTRAQKLAKALKGCKKPKKKRPACERQARKRYRALNAKKTSRGRK